MRTKVADASKYRYWPLQGYPDADTPMRHHNYNHNHIHVHIHNHNSNINRNHNSC